VIANGDPPKAVKESDEDLQNHAPVDNFPAVAEAGYLQPGPDSTAMGRVGENVNPGHRALSLALAAVSDERDALAEELKRVKRKYRRATTDAQNAKREAGLLKQQLAASQARVASIEQRSFSAIFERFVRRGTLSWFKRPRSGKALRSAQIELVRKSHFFDADWYLATYPDVAKAKLDPAVHFVMDGWSEGRDPGPDFSSSRYLKANSDVAQSGINPLIHYLEHGLAEGRSAGSGGLLLQRRSAEDFGPPSPVFRALVAPSEPVRWARHYQLHQSRKQLQIGQVAGGYYPVEALPSIAAALARFWKLSGLLGDHPLFPHGEGVGPSCSPKMIDGWFIGQSLYQSRWDLEGGEPLVIRGLQRGRNGTVQLIGEGLVRTSFDVVDFPAAHPFFPVLILSCSVDGEIRSATNLFFPSLSRGGLSYAEALTDGRGQEISPISVGERYARSLEAILCGDTSPVLRAIRVDLAGADGTSAIFQADCQDWLDWVLRVDLEDAIVPDGVSAANRFLSDRASKRPCKQRVRGSSSGELILPSDSLPTIAALVAAEDGGIVCDAPTAMSMIVVKSDPAKPALAVVVPKGFVAPAELCAPAFPLAFPRMVGAKVTGSHFPVAIKSLPGGGLAESELLQPLAQPLLILPPPVSPKDLVVAIEPALWPVQALETGLTALGRQIGGQLMTICMIGTVDPQRRAMIELEFAGRTSSRPNVHAFVEELTEGHVLHLGPGVILHDNRTLVTFQSLLENAASASCPILTCTRRGKNWAIRVADAGRVLNLGLDTNDVALAPRVDVLWRSIFPVSGQPGNLWAARADVLRDAPEAAERPHLFCGWVTASYWDAEPQEQATLNLPAARAEVSLGIEELVG
jgi:hypothetical protein